MEVVSGRRGTSGPGRQEGSSGDDMAVGAVAFLAERQVRYTRRDRGGDKYPRLIMKVVPGADKFWPRRLVQGVLGKPASPQKKAEFIGLLPDLLNVSRDEVGDDLDGDPDPQTVLQVVKLQGGPGIVLNHVSSPSSREHFAWRAFACALRQDLPISSFPFRLPFSGSVAAHPSG
jgi:hypothetical protein